ncbi:MAG: histidine kinase [Muribaculaceae bacterium]|nr:histidine kinase [Muribaculaceae bacterium]
MTTASFKKLVNQEKLIYLVVWIIWYIAPLVVIYSHSQLNEERPFEWRPVLIMWENITVFFVAFILHNWLLAPLLVFKHKTKLYVAGILLLMATFTVFQCSHHPRGPRHPREMAMEKNKPEPHMRHMPPPNRPPMGMHDVGAFALFLFMIGANLGVKQYFKSQEDHKQYEELKQASLEQELEYLKYQINPHFFMNTLNNIHALVDIDPDRAKTSVVELSKLMRYLLYEGTQERIDLQRGIDFLEHYFSLMRLRYTDKVRINFSVPPEIPNVQIPPLLMVPFVENAFKHGVSYQNLSFVDVTMTIEDNILHFACSNSKNDSQQERGGVGLANVRKRLDLIYGDSYHLTTTDGPTVYSMQLDIPLNV